MAKGAAWMMTMRLFNRSVGFISTLILARLLVPEDFGLIAMAMVFSSLLVAISDMSVHVPLIQKSVIDDADLNSAWSLQVMLSLAQSVVLTLAASWVAEFYGEPRLESIVYALALITLVGGLQNTGVIMFQRDMQFHKEFVFLSIVRILTFVVTISIAFWLRSYIALLSGMLVGAASRVILSFVMHNHRPRWCVEKFLEFFHFSKWMLLNNILKFLGQRGVELVIGKTMGARSVGLFSIGSEIATLPTTELAAPINRVSLSGYSRLQGDENALKQSYLDVLGLIALVVLPTGIGIAISADRLVPLLLGENWIATIPLIEVLAVVGSVSCLLSNSGSVFLAKGKPRLLAFISLIRILALIPAMIYLSSVYGLVGVAFAMMLATAVWVALILTLLMRELSMHLQELVAVILRPVIAVISMAAMVRFAGINVQVSNLWIDTALTISVGALTYSLCIVLLWFISRRPLGAETRLAELCASSLRWPLISR
ncbi:MAG: lipopolysaccharide biosynthesis protein [Pseudomonadales bacterium]